MRLWLWLLLSSVLFPALAGAQTCLPTTTTATTATLAWDPGLQPPDVVVTSYAVERQTDTGPWAPIAETPPGVTTYTDTGLTPGHTYTWRAFTVASGGATPRSLQATWGAAPLLQPCLTVPALIDGPVCTPTTTTATTATLAWDPGLQPSDVVVTSYAVERQTDTGPWAPVAETPPGVTTYTDTGLTPGHTYTWRVFTVANGGRDPRSAQATWGAAPLLQPCLTVHASPCPPCLAAALPPVTPLLTATAVPSCTHGCVALTWETLPAGTAVRIERRIATSTVWTEVREGMLTRPWVDTHAPPVREVCYRARWIASTTWSPEQCVQTR